ncbi:Rhodanese-like domain-containing protein [Xylaria sp. CBS 124048]|nr:Rhodanese-like domain-containing protein [Xylaria sp. CBS 124048]
MASVPTRRNVLATLTSPASRALAAFGQGLSSFTARAISTRIIHAPQQQQQQQRGLRYFTPITPISVQRSSYSTHSTQETSTEPPKPSKIWSFEDVHTLVSASHRPSLPSLSPLFSPTSSPSPAVLIDVREPAELLESGRIPGALNIPLKSSPDSFFLTDEEFEARFGFARPAPDAEVVFYCRSGVRCQTAATLATEAGWASVGVYPGSWLDWEGKGGEVEREKI